MSTRTCHRKRTRPERRAQRQTEAINRQKIYDALSPADKKTRNPKKFS